MVDQLIKHAFASTPSDELMRLFRPPFRIEPARFMGRWYELETFRQPYAPNATDGQALYALIEPPPSQDKAAVKLENSCLQWNKKRTAQKVLRMTGTVKVLPDDGASNSQLVVNFDDLFMGIGTHFSSVNMCILDCTPDYGFMMMGTPSHDGLWLMGRTTAALPAAISARFYAKARMDGFDVRKLEPMAHTSTMAISTT